MPQEKEFRTNQLNIGGEVKVIAVPAPHREEVQKFLTDHQLQNKVKICDLDLLKQNMNSSDFDNAFSAMPDSIVHGSCENVSIITSVNSELSS